MADHDPKATADLLRRLYREGALTREQTSALEAVLRQHLPWRQRIGRILLALGAGLLVSGIIFFFAYNWAALPHLAKFGVIEGAILIAALVAWWAGLESYGGKIAVFAAAAFTGVFLAVHGQTYQTGADSWLLFAAWAALILPWTVLLRFPALWVFWLLLIDLAVFLWSGERHRFSIFGLLTVADVFTLLGAVNAAALALWETGVTRGWRWMNEGWVRAFVILLTFGLYTAAVCLVIIDAWGQASSVGGTAVAVWLGSSVLAYWFYRQVQPSLACLTVVVLSFCINFVTAIGRAVLHGTHDPVGIFLLMSLIVLIVFCGAVFWLRRVGQVIQSRSLNPQP